MSHQQPYTYHFQSSGHGTLKDSSKADQASTTASETPSERTPLKKGASGYTRIAVERTSPDRMKPFHRPGGETAQDPTTAVLGSRMEGLLHCDLDPGLSTSDVSLSLVNSGSVARDHLASERTFLAYVRTSLAIACAGVALAQILTITESYSDTTPRRESRVETWARPLGATAVVIALLVLFIGELLFLQREVYFKKTILGVARYFVIQKALVGGQFPASRVGLGLVSILLGALIVATFGVLFHDRLSMLW
ncbi:hypothetical protein H2248_012459 [Termitomyces sp. 'cryptogamus']|nr:hypothetical protein H2248_012459 [Termitomyces sp. 'cryptogamus']